MTLMIEELKELQDSDLDELENMVEPTWPGLVDPLEKIMDRLRVVWGIVNHLNAVKDSPELRSAIEDVQVCHICIYKKENSPQILPFWYLTTYDRSI